MTDNKKKYVWQVLTYRNGAWFPFIDPGYYGNASSLFAIGAEGKARLWIVQTFGEYKLRKVRVV